MAVVRSIHLHRPVPALILDGNQRSALATVRTLGRKSVEVIVVEKEPRSLAATSRFCRSSDVCPDPSVSPVEFVDWLSEANRRYAGAVLMPMTDTTVPLV